MDNNQSAIGVSGAHLAMRIRIQPPSDQHFGTSTTGLVFTEAEHLLSKKPLRRPNRSKPLPRGEEQKNLFE